MKIKLIQGAFGKEDAVSLLTQIIHVKIKFHENKIQKSHNEEDIKMRESRIKQLQKELYELRSAVNSITGIVYLDSTIEVGKNNSQKENRLKNNYVAN
ncbi:MAG: hypothetical protein J0M08_01865 [Bacteroidetes bacterium]|nr:hypothetical protein [Bacteroidota bacterium]